MRTIMVSLSIRNIPMSAININSTVEAFYLVIEESNSKDADKLRKLEEKALIENNNQRPTMDANGRLHAPCEGYIWGSDVYHAGSYLSYEYDMKHPQNNKTKFKTTVETATLLSNTFKSLLHVGHGASWNDSGIEICYCYIDGLTNTQLKNILALTQDLEAKTKSEIISNRPLMTEGKQSLVVTVLSSFTRFNNYTDSHDLKLNVTDENNACITLSVTSKMWELVESKIDELFNKEISLNGTIKSLGDKSYQILRPNKIKLT
jgi:hypothetical protein